MNLVFRASVLGYFFFKNGLGLGLEFLFCYRVWALGLGFCFL
jgi:hypothetical protein